MSERIKPIAKSPNEFFQDERFSRFRRIQIPFGKSIVEIPDPEAVEAEGREKKKELEGKAAEHYGQRCSWAAANLRETIIALKSVAYDDSRIFEKLNRARHTYALAATHLGNAEIILGSKIDKKV